MRNRAFAVLATVVTLVACSQEPPPSAPPDEPSVGPQPIVDFTATITAPTDGPGLGGTPGNTVWALTTVGTGGGSGVNPPRTVELRTISPFATAGASGTCLAATIAAPVQITNYFPERLMNLYVAFAWTNPSTHALCTSDPAPGELVFGSGPGFSYGFGNLMYTSGYFSVPASIQTPDPGTVPGCTTCVAAGGSAARDWWFDYVSGGSFTVAGRIFAELVPPMPAITSPHAPSLSLGDWGQLPLRIWIYSTRDSEANPFVSELRLDICPATSGACTGATTTYFVTRDGPHKSEHRDDFSFGNTELTTGANAGKPPLALHTEYFMKAWARWWVDGVGDAAGTRIVESTFPLQKSFRLAGPTTQLAPADDSGFGEGDFLQWSTEFPEPGRESPTTWDIPAGFQICSSPEVISFHNSCTGSLIFITLNPGEIGVSSLNNVHTYTWNLASWTGSSPFPRPAPGTAGYWRVRTDYSEQDFNGLWTPTRKIVFGNKPTNPVSGNPTLTFDLVSTNSTSVQVQWCSDSVCLTPLGTAAASGGPASYTYNSTGITRPFYWRARAVYPNGNGPWSSPVVAP